MKWFKTIWLNSEERAALKAVKEPKSDSLVESGTSTKYPDTATQIAKPYKNIYYSNRNVTVIFQDGSVLSRSGVDYDLFNKIRNSWSQKEVESFLIQEVKPPEPASDTKTESKEERQLVADNLDILKTHPEFMVQGNQVMLKGVNLPMPASVISSFIEILEKEKASMASGGSRDVVDSYLEQYEALKMFWLKLALNTLPQSREDLLLFVRKNDVRITRNGNIILYRRIVTKGGADTTLVTFVTQEYYRIKKEGFDPRQFAITNDFGVYRLVDLNEFDPARDKAPFCNLQQMYLELPTYDVNSFTSAHDRSVEIKVGGVYKIPETKINLNNGLCAAGGLHAACVNYNYAGFGDMPVVVLVNPSKAITVPTGDMGKLRTTEMFIACVNDKPQGQHFDESALSVFDEEYHDLTLEELEVAAKAKSFENLSIEENVPAVSLVDLKTIKDMLKSRIKEAIW